MNIRAKIFGGTSLADEPLLKAKRPKGAKPRSLDSVVVPRETRRQSNSRGGDRHRLSGEKAQVIAHGVRLIHVVSFPKNYPAPHAAAICPGGKPIRDNARMTECSRHG